MNLCLVYPVENAEGRLQKEMKKEQEDEKHDNLIQKQLWCESGSYLQKPVEFYCQFAG